MRLLRVALTDVRGVGRCEAAFDPSGVTVVEAPNESGKTTLLDAVDVLLEMKDSSNAARVRQLQPVDRDVGSTIEVELTCGDTHLTCTKTFNRDRATVLTLHAPIRETLTGADAHARLRTILESEVDLALYAALRFDQGRDLDAVTLGASNVLAARLDAAAGGTGTADDGVLDRAEREYQRFFTRTGRETAALTDRDRDVDAATEHRDDLAARLAAFERDVDDLARIERELPELIRRRDDELTPALTTMREQAARVAQVEAAIGVQQAELRRATAERLEVSTTRDERARSAARADELTRELEEHEALLAPRRARADDLDEQRAARADELRRADEAAVAAADSRDRAQRVADLVAARTEYDDLARRSARVAEVLDDARDAERGLAGLRIDDDRLRAVRDAVQDLRVAEATLAAGAPTVRIHARRALDVLVDGEVASLDTGGELTRPVGDHLEVAVPDVVTLEVRAGTSSDDLVREVQRARERLRDVCRDAGATDPAEAERLATARAEHRAVLDRRDAQLARELDGRDVTELADALRAAEDRVTALQAAWPDVDDLPGLDAAREAATAATAAARIATDALATHRAGYDELLAAAQAEHTAVQVAGSQQQARQDEHDRLEARLTVERAQRDDAALDDAVEAAVAAEAAAQDRLEATQAELAELEPDVVSLTAANLDAQLVDLDARALDLEQRRATLRERLRLGGQDGLGEALTQAEDVLERARRDQRRVRARASAAKLLVDELRTARDEAYRTYRAPLRDRINGKVRLLLGGDAEVELGDDLAIVGRISGGIRLDFAQLSAGAREQLSILAALSAAELAGSDGVPFVLDDALGYTDPDRLERLGALLGRTTDAQVIVLTCMADRFRHVGGAHTVRLLDPR